MDSNIKIEDLYGKNKSRNYRIAQTERLGYTVITPADISATIDQFKRKGYKNNTIRNYVGELRRAIKNYCYSNKKYDVAFIYNLVFSQYLLKADKDCTNQSDIITQSKMADLMKVIPDKKNKLIMMFLIVTGVRISEFCNIRLKDCSLSKEENIVHIRIVQGKNNRSREIVIPIELYYAVRELHSTVYLFETNNGRKFRQPTIAGRFKRIAKRFGQRLYPHLFRHSHITMMLEKGFDMKQLSKLCGVQPEIMVRTYFHIKTDFKGAAEMTRPMLSLIQ